MTKQNISRSTNRVVRSVLRHKLIILSTTLIATVIFTVVAHGHSSPAGNESAQPTIIQTGKVSSPVTGMVSQQGPFGEVPVKLSSNGFDPAQFTHAAGRFHIFVENLNLTGEYRLQLKAADGSLLKEITVQKGSTVWDMDLQAGQYTLTEATHSAWVCQITVQ